MKLFIGVLVAVLSSHVFAEQLPLTSANVSIAQQSVTYTVHKDGRTDIKESTTMEALSDQGRVTLSLQRRQYHLTSEKVQILDAGLVAAGMSDRRAVKVPPKKIVDKPIASMKTGLTDIHEIVVPFEGVKVHSKTLVVAQHQILKPVLPGYFHAEFTYGVGCPEINSTVLIQSEMPLYFQISDPSHRLLVTQSMQGSLFITQIKMIAPIYAVSEEALEKQNVTNEQLKAIPRVYVSSAVTWQNLNETVSQLYAAKMREPLPPVLQDVVKRIAPTATVAEKISFLRESISNLITYSGRWTEASSAWEPRSLQTIVNEKVGDCKDFAFVFLRLAREVGLTADFVFAAVPTTALESYLFEPIDPRQPLPSVVYFSHAVVQIQRGGESIYIDPTGMIAQGDSTDIGLLHTRIWVLGRNDRLPMQRIGSSKIENSKIETTISPLGSGLVLSTKFELNSSLAQYFQQLQFSSQSARLPEALAALAGFPESTQLKVVRSLPPDRKRGHLEFELQYFNQSTWKVEAGQSKLVYLAAVPAFNWGLKGLNPPDVLYRLEKTTRIPGYFARKEELGDCVLRGPLINSDRVVKNLKDQIFVNEATWTGSVDIESLAETEDGKTSLRYGIGLIRDCTDTTLAIEKINPTDVTQVAFEQSPRAKLPDHPSPQTFNADLRLMWRVNKTLTETNPRNAEAWYQMGKSFEKLGMITSDLYLAEFQLEAYASYSRAIQVDPKMTKAWASIGQIVLKKGDVTRATTAYVAARRLDPNSFEAAVLGGDISMKQGLKDRALQFYQFAQTHANDSYDKAAVVSEEIKILAEDKATYGRAAELIALLPTLRPGNPWVLNNAAGYYVSIYEYEKAIKLAREALKIMKFGVGQETLSIALSMHALDLAEKGDSASLDQAEAEDSEAASFLPDDNWVNYTMALIAVQRLKKSADRRYVTIGEMSLRKIQRGELVSDRQIQNITLMFNFEKAKLERKDRMVAGVAAGNAAPNPNFAALAANYNRLITTDEGRRYDDQSTQEVMKHKSVLIECGILPGDSFKAVIEVDSQGFLTKWEGEIQTQEAACLRSKMVGLKITPPKIAPFNTLISATVH